MCLCLCVKCRPVSLPHQHQKFKEDATFFVCFFIPLLNTQFKHDGSIVSDSDLFVHDNLQFYFFNFSIFSKYCVIMSIWFMCTLNDYMYLRECVTVGPGVNCVHEWFSWVCLFDWRSSKSEHWKVVLKNRKEHMQWRMEAHIETCKRRKAIQYLETINSRKKTCMTKLQTILSHLWAHKTIMLSSSDTHASLPDCPAAIHVEPTAYS